MYPKHLVVLDSKLVGFTWSQVLLQISWASDFFAKPGSENSRSIYIENNSLVLSSIDFCWTKESSCFWSVDKQTFCKKVRCVAWIWINWVFITVNSMSKLCINISTQPLVSPERFHHPCKIVLFLKILEISHISKPIPGMFVLISMYFSMVIPNIVTKFQNFDIFETFVNCLTCRLLMPSALKVLKSIMCGYLMNMMK